MNNQIDARIVTLDRTNDYAIKDQHKSAVARIMDVFLYDKNEHTHCCEFTPSYWLIYLYSIVELTPIGESLNDYQKDEIYQDYEHCPTDDCYVHCHSIDAMNAYNYGDPEFNSDDATHDEMMEALREHFQANCPV